MSRPVPWRRTRMMRVLSAPVGVLRQSEASLRGRRLSRQWAGMPDATVLGRDERGRPVAVRDGQLRAHALIVGASGSGKTTTLLKLLTAQLARGRPLVAIDLKGSPAFAAALQAAAAQNDRPFRCWSLDGTTHWNPLALGNPTELKDKLIATERFSEPHYRRAAERYLQTALQVLQELEPWTPPSLRQVTDLLDPKRLAAAAATLPAPRAEAIKAYSKNLSRDQQSAVSGLASRLAVITESAPGLWLEPHADAIRLDQSLARGEAVLFSLNASAYGSLAGQLGTLVVQDLISVAGRRLQQSAQPPLALVAIDEFSALQTDNVMNLLARGRESGVGVLLATQELADLDRAATGLRDQVLGNTNVQIVHRQNVPESARFMAHAAGQVEDWQLSYSRRSGGRSSLTARLAERPLIPPSKIQRLATGEAVVATKSPAQTAAVTRIGNRGIKRRSRRSGIER